MEKYFVIGGGELQADFIRKLKEKGFEVHVFDLNPNCIGKTIGHYFHQVSIDDKYQILKVAEDLGPIAVHSVATEQGNVSACYVSEKLGLPGNSYQTALATTDKLLMKDVLYKNNIDTPKASVYKSISEINVSDISFPCIVKSSDRSAGRGVKMVENTQELYDAAKESFHYSFNKTILIEEYFDAQQYSVEAISFDGDHHVVGITQQGFSGPPFFVEYADSMPALLNEETTKNIQKFVFKVLNAFKIKVGASHIELRVKDNQIKIIELASRMGGWRHWMTKAALNYDYLEAIINSTLGQKYTISEPINHKIAVSRHIINNVEMKRYLHRKKNNKNLFVIDLVKRTKGSFSAQNLIETRGFYILCTNIKDLDSVFSKEEIIELTKFAP